MSEGTTKPSGSREINVEETEDVKRRIKEAGYDIEINALEARFSEEKVQEDGTTGGSDSAKPTKAGDHTIVPNKATIIFRQLIPFIAAGAKAKLKSNKTKIKPEDRENDENNKTRNGNREQDRT